MAEMLTPDAKLLKFATEFRRGLLGRRPSRQMCFAVCAPLETLLELHGFSAKLVQGHIGEYEHFWLRLPDGRILDPTADQFRKPDGGKMPRVYIGKKPEWYLQD